MMKLELKDKIIKSVLIFGVAFVLGFVLNTRAHAHEFGQNYDSGYCDYLETVAEQILYRHYLHPDWTKTMFLDQGREIYKNQSYQYQDYKEIVNSAFLKPIDKMGPTKEKLLSQLKEFGVGAYQECFENQNEPPSE